MSETIVLNIEDLVYCPFSFSFTVTLNQVRKISAWAVEGVSRGRIVYRINGKTKSLNFVYKDTHHLTGDMFYIARDFSTNTEYILKVIQ